MEYYMPCNDVVTKQLEYFKEYFESHKKPTEQEAITTTTRRRKRNNNGLGYNIYRTGEQHLIENLNKLHRRF